MKSLYRYLLNSKPIISFLFCYAIIVLVGLVQKLFLFSFSQGDVFYYLFDFIRNSFSSNDATAAKFLSYIMFLGSFYGIFIRAFLFLVLMFLYAAFIQFLLHIFIKNPVRFGNILSIFFTIITMLYLLFFIPVVGAFLFSFGFIYFAGKEIGKADGFSTLWGILLVIAPKLILISLLFLTAASFLNIASFF